MCYTALMAIGSMLRRRWLPEKSFPSYAYLPGRQPHPVRDPAAHSYNSEAMLSAAEISPDSDTFLWGLDLFNHGYYWEAPEACGRVCGKLQTEALRFGRSSRGLILLSAAGVKIREGKQSAATALGQPQPVFDFILGPSSGEGRSARKKTNSHPLTSPGIDRTRWANEKGNLLHYVRCTSG